MLKDKTPPQDDNTMENKKKISPPADVDHVANAQKYDAGLDLQATDSNEKSPLGKEIEGIARRLRRLKDSDTQRHK